MSIPTDGGPGDSGSGGVLAPLDVAAPVLEPHSRRRVLAARAVLALLLALALGAAWLVWDNRRLVVTPVAVAASTWPAGERPLRIAHVSDLHGGGDSAARAALVESVAAQHPDLVAITGDLVDRRTRDLSGALEVASSLAGIAPTTMVLGNHEADSPLRDELLTGMTGAGVQVLRDEVTTIEVRGTTVTVAGIDDPRVASVDGVVPADPGTVLDSLRLPTDAPVVLLAHRPELWEHYVREDVDLVLSGHAHGGQVRVPGIGGLYAPHQGWLPALTEGAHVSGTTTMVISRGLGDGMLPVRVNNPHELVIVDLAASPSG